jgi:hypothetical protein
MLDPLDAEDLRRWAKQCEAKAKQIVLPLSERERLLKTREALLALADNADWLCGRSRDVAVQNAAE